MTIDTTQMCSHLQKKILILAGKSLPKVVRADQLNELSTLL